MEEIKNIILCGLGAIGSIYAVNFSQYDNNILNILVDKKRFEKYEQEPLIFNGKEYNFNYITPDTIENKADLIIIATKNNGLDEAICNIKNCVGEKTVILSLLNGIESEERIAQVYGKEKVLYSYYIGHTSTRKGREITHDGVYKTVFGEKDNSSLSKNVKKVKNLFDKAGINYEIPKDMDYSRWWKFLVNVGYNQASAVLNASYGDFQKSKKTNTIAIKLMEEAATIAKAEGVKNTENFIPEVLSVIEKMLPETRTSMLQDIDAKRQTEVDIFAGYVSKLGKKHNISTPYNDMFFELIKSIDEKNSNT